MGSPGTVFKPESNLIESYNPDGFLEGSEILRVDNIYKSFGKTTVLCGISFSLKEREILGIIGPSGGGKSTLLRCLDLLENIDRGEIEYYGKFNLLRKPNGYVVLTKGSSIDEEELSEEVIISLRRGIGIVFQGFNLWEERTVLENLTLAPRVVLNKPRNRAENDALRLCLQFGLENKLKARVWELSGGQRQRVAIMRALMMKPKIILLDEITSALDPVLTVEVMAAIRQLRDTGLAMILVTHHIEFASSLCDRIMFLSHGCAIQIDTPDNLRKFPANDEVRRFLELLQSAR